MEKTENQKLTWWERNKKKVFIIGGIVIIGGISLVLFKNRDILRNLLKANGKLDSDEVFNVVEKAVEVFDKHSDVLETIITESKTPINNGELFKVQGHIRNLGDNLYPSPQKVAEAKELGIILGEHQTYVDTYYKNVDVA